MPGNRANMLERARDFNADIIMYDLEDSVPSAEKVNARDMARHWVPDLRKAGRRVMVRCNGLDTGLTRDELAAVIGPDLYGVSVGKTESSWDIQEIDRIIGPYEAAAGLAEDYTVDMGLQRTDSGEEVYVPRATAAIAARAAGVASLDSPYVAFRNPEGLKEDCSTARQLGYNGKFAIHPAQIDTINETFSPNPEDVAYARRVMEAWNQAEAAGRGSLDLDGKMVDVPVVKRAQNLLALVEAINQQSRA